MVTENNQQTQQENNWMEFSDEKEKLSDQIRRKFKKVKLLLKEKKLQRSYCFHKHLNFKLNLFTLDT